MRSGNPSRGTVTALVVSVAVVVMAGTAFACTQTSGKMTVSAYGPGMSGSATADGYGDHTTNGAPTYCDGDRTFSYFPASGRGTLTGASGAFMLTVGRTTLCSRASFDGNEAWMPPGLYEVRWIAALEPHLYQQGSYPLGNTGLSYSYNCMSTAVQGSMPTPSGVAPSGILGTIDIVGTPPYTSGTAGPFALPSHIGPVNICINGADRALGLLSGLASAQVGLMVEANFESGVI